MNIYNDKRGWLLIMETLEHRSNQGRAVNAIQSETKSSKCVFEQHNMMKYCVVIWGYFFLNTPMLQYFLSFLNPCCWWHVVSVFACCVLCYRVLYCKLCNRNITNQSAWFLSLTFSCCPTPTVSSFLCPSGLSEILNNAHQLKAWKGRDDGSLFFSFWSCRIEAYLSFLKWPSLRWISK